MLSKRVFYIIACALLVVAFWIVATFLKEGGSSPRYNLILISLDTLRADRVGAYGYSRDTSPNIDALAKQGALFRNTVSVTSWTLPAHVSMLSGLYPSGHGVLTTRRKISQKTKLLAEVLSQAGYRTFGYTGGGNIHGRWGFSRGFEEYTGREDKRGAARQGFGSSVDHAIEKINTLNPEEHFFFFLHTYDIHCPYTPPEPYFSMFQSEVSEAIPTNLCGAEYHKKHKITQGEINYISDHYDGGIRWVDSVLGELLQYLKSKDLLKNTYIILTSDHGDEFFEHGRIGHRQSLNKELIMVPLIIAGPKVTPDKKIDTAVSLVDIFPTALDLLGLKKIEEVQGQSLSPLLINNGREFKPRDFEFSELNRLSVLRSRITPEDHFITDKKKDRNLLYDLSKDPTERNNIASEDPKTVERYQSELRELEIELESHLANTEHEKVEKGDTEELEKLKTLGYL